MKLSIVVPVYNVERYIVKCIKSLLLNETDDYEVIIVNDGTKDSSVELVKLHFNDEKIRIVEQENAGLSAARNMGVKFAKGEYIWFVDSDDWVEPHSVDWICSILSGGECDILYQPYTFECIEGNAVEIKKHYFADIKRGIELLKLSKCATCAPYYIVKRSFWIEKQFAFYVGILHEDNELMYKVIYSAKTIRCLDKPVYYHNIRPGSITQTFNPKRCYSLEIVCSSLYDYLVKNVDSCDYSIFAHYIIDAFYAMLDAAKDGDEGIKSDINSYIAVNKNILSVLWKFGDMKARIFYCACTLSGRHYVQTCALFRKLMGARNRK